MDGDQNYSATAFPTFVHPQSVEGREMAGMSLRDWFAGQALCGMSVNAEASSVEAVPDLMLTVADLAYKMADAMLAERSKP